MNGFLVPDWDAPPHVGALSTMRMGGCSLGSYDDGHGGRGLNLGNHVGDVEEHVALNRAIVAREICANPVWLEQVHGSSVTDAAMAATGERADASLITQTGFACTIMTADCLPVLLTDRAGTVVAAAHGGWRGLAGGILEQTVARMRISGATDLIAWMGPAIGPAKFEVGAEVRAAFVDHNGLADRAFRPIPGVAGKYLADIFMLARMRLEGAGVEQVFGGGLCTVSDPRFYSYRRDRVTGRMASLVWIRPRP